MSVQRNEVDDGSNKESVKDDDDDDDDNDEEVENLFIVITPIWHARLPVIFDSKSLRAGVNRGQFLKVSKPI
jgi:hypothetical protein